VSEIKLKLRPWMAPNFAVPESPPGRREDGVRFEAGIHVRDLPVETLAEMADEWRAELFRKAGKKDPRRE
jgi:hypothetical protein